MMRAAAVSLILVIGLSVTAAAQTPAAPASALDRRPSVVDDIVTAGTQAAMNGQSFSTALGPGARQRIAAYLIAAHVERATYAALLTALETARVDKQVGATSNGSGSTSLAMKGLAPKILGFAVERGALTQEVSGTSMTFRLSPTGLIKALQGSDLVALQDSYARDGVQRFSARFSAAVTFDVARGPDAGVFTASNQQLASWSARYQFINHRDPASADYANEWRSLLGSDTASYRQSVVALNDALGSWPQYTQWEADVIKAITMTVDPSGPKPDITRAATTFRSLLVTRLSQLESMSVPAPVLTALDAYAHELAGAQRSIDGIYRFVGRGPLLTGDLTATRSETLPDLYTGTAIFEAGLGKSRKTDLTINAAVNTYTSVPAGATKSLKSIDLTSHLEHPLGGGSPTPTVSFAFRYSYLPYDTVAVETVASGPATTTPAAAGTNAVVPKGSIALFQFKLTVPVKDSGLRVPISVTASNRTELIEEKDVRGSIGLTFDLDAFIGALSSAVK